MKRPLLAVLLLPPFLGDAVLLRPFVHKGDQWTTTTECEWNLVQTFAARGSEKKEEKGGVATSRALADQVESRITRRDKFDTEVLETKEDLAFRVRRDYTRSILKTRVKPPDGEAHEGQEDTPLNQASFVLQREGEGTKLESGGGTLGERWKAGLEIDPISALFLPAERVEEGKEWPVDARKLGGFFRHQAGRFEMRDLGGALRSTLRGLKEEKGRKVAEITIEGDVSYTLDLGGEDSSVEPLSLPLVLTLKGTMHFDPASSRPTAFTLEGKIEPRGGSPEPARPTAVQGTMRFTLEVEDRAQPSGEAVKLFPRFHAADVVTRTDKTKFELAFDEITVKVDGKPLDTSGMPKQTIKVSTTLKTTDEILEAAEGKIKKLRREFQEISIEYEGPVPQKESPLQDLEGKAVVLETDGDEVEAKLEGSGKIDEKVLKSLTMGDEFRYLLPEDEVKKGSSWAPDEKKIAEVLTKAFPAGEDEEDEASGMDMKSLLKKVSGSFDCKLLEFSEEDGVPTARVALKASFDLDLTQDDFPEEQREEGVDVEVSFGGKLDGEFLFDYRSGKPLKLTIAGPISLRMKMDQSNDESGMSFERNMKASGTIEMEQSYAKGRTKK